MKGRQTAWRVMMRFGIFRPFVHLLDLLYPHLGGRGLLELIPAVEGGDSHSHLDYTIDSSEQMAPPCVHKGAFQVKLGSS